MNRYTFLIDYEVFDSDNISLKKGQIKVKNKTMEIEAKFSLEEYLKRKYPLFNRLTIYKCQKATSTFLGDITNFDDFMNIFK